MKAIIPVAGIGTRLRPHTHTQPKSLIPVAGKPILGHIVENLVQQGFTEIIYIIGYMGDKVEQYITTNYPDITNHFVIQTIGKGTGHAIWLAKDLIRKDDELFIVLGDTIFDADLGKILSGRHSALGVKRVKDPRDFGVAQTDERGFITHLVEKPNIPKSNMALVGAYYVKEGNELLKAIEYNLQHDIRTNNEFHLTDALMQMIRDGIAIETFEVDTWFDCGKKEILLETNATLLKRLPAQHIDKEKYPNTILIPPVYIADTCKISNSIIGPNVSIGDHTIIDYSIIRETIIGPHAQLDYAVLKNSLIGNDAMLRGMLQSLNLGDSTEINFS